MEVERSGEAEGTGTTGTPRSVLNFSRPLALNIGLGTCGTCLDTESRRVCEHPHGSGSVETLE